MWGYLFVAPQMIGLIAFILGPVIASFVISLTEWDAAGGDIQWRGFANYTRYLQDEPIFWKVFGNTLYFAAASVPLAIVLALIAALALNRPMRAVGIHRALFFAPTVTSSVAIGMLFAWLFNPDFGPINVFLSMVGVTGPRWLADPSWAMPGVVVVAVWHGIGYNLVIFLAGLKNIPRELYEAARVDGASDFQRFLHITLPLLSPTTFFITVVSIIGSFKVFDLVWIMTGGGPVNATNVLLILMYQVGFQYFRLGEAAAIAWMLFLLILAVTLAQFRVSRWVHYG